MWNLISNDSHDSQGGIAPNQVIARSEFEVHRRYGVNVTKAVIGAYM